MRTRDATLLAAAVALLVAAACTSEPGVGAKPPTVEAGAQPARPLAARAEGVNWTAALEVPGPPRAGEGSRGLVRITAREGMHVNEEYPTSFRPSPESRAGFSGDRVALAEVVERVPCAGEEAYACAVTFALPYAPPAPDAQGISGTLSFSVCNAELCLIEKVSLAATTPAR